MLGGQNEVWGLQNNKLDLKEYSSSKYIRSVFLSSKILNDLNPIFTKFQLSTTFRFKNIVVLTFPLEKPFLLNLPYFFSH